MTPSASPNCCCKATPAATSCAKLALEARGATIPIWCARFPPSLSAWAAGFNCGSLTGGCCVLGLYGGRADENESVHPRFDLMIEEFTGWFEREMTEKYGGVNCRDIIDFDFALKQQRCPEIILECWEKIKQVLAKHGARAEGPAPAVWAED